MESVRGPAVASAASSLAMIGVVAGTGCHAVTGWVGARWLAEAGLLAYYLIELPRITVGGRRMLLVAILVAGAAIALIHDPLPVFDRALGASASLAGLFAALGFLREAAVSSPLVHRSGAVMVRQPPGRRYLVLAAGAHMVALVLNIGVLSLLGTMVMEGNTVEAAGGDERIVAIRRQRMITAVLRGFTLTTIWSPLSISFAVVQAVVPGVVWIKLVPLQAVLTALMLALGWALDRLAFRHTGLVPPVVERQGGWGVILRLALLIAVVMAISLAVAGVLGTPLIMGAVLFVPVAAWAWLAAQHRGGGPVLAGIEAAKVMAGRLSIALPNFRSEVATVGGAMFMGVVVAALVTPALSARIMGDIGLPPLALIILLPWTVIVLARIGVSQIVAISLLGGAFADLGSMGIDPLILASGLMGAWALAVSFSPVGAAVLMTARIAGVPSAAVRKWNRVYGWSGAVVLALWMLALYWSMISR
jgi:hypothetical protein